MNWVRKGQEQAPKVQPPARSNVSKPAPEGKHRKLPIGPLCKDCVNNWGGGPEPKWRPAPFPGPRCYTHNLAEKKRKKKTRQNSYQVKNFGITLEEKEELIEFQGGGCICSEWTGYNGKSRALSTDHDHATGVIRGALCKHCNDLLGRVRDDPRYFQRMIAYLNSPPAVRLLGKRIAPEE